MATGQRTTLILNNHLVFLWLNFFFPLLLYCEILRLVYFLGPAMTRTIKIAADRRVRRALWTLIAIWKAKLVKDGAWVIVGF